MSRRRPAFTVVAAATMLTAALALSGCSAGTVTQTDTIVSGAPGGTGQAGGMLARNMTLTADPDGAITPGAQVALSGTLVNQSPQADQLVSASTPFAQSVSIEGLTQIPGDYAVRLVDTVAGPVGPVRPDVREIATARIVLRGVTQVMRPGPTYAVTLNFARQGPMTIPVTMVEAGQPAG